MMCLTKNVEMRFIVGSRGRTKLMGKFRDNETLGKDNNMLVNR